MKKIRRLVELPQLLHNYALKYFPTAVGRSHELLSNRIDLLTRNVSKLLDEIFCEQGFLMIGYCFAEVFQCSSKLLVSKIRLQSCASIPNGPDPPFVLTPSRLDLVGREN